MCVCVCVCVCVFLCVCMFVSIVSVIFFSLPFRCELYTRICVCVHVRRDEKANAEFTHHYAKSQRYYPSNSSTSILFTFSQYGEVMFFLSSFVSIFMFNAPVNLLIVFPLFSILSRLPVVSNVLIVLFIFCVIVSNLLMQDVTTVCLHSVTFFLFLLTSLMFKIFSFSSFFYPTY